MKHLIFSAVALFLFNSYGLAQSKEASKEQTNQRSSEVKLKNLDPRQNYHWANGTTSTPAGREAGSAAIDGSYLSGRHVDAAIRVPSYRESLSRSTKSDLLKLDQRKNYHWKDGTTATPTGHEATAIGGGYASLGHQEADDEPVTAGRGHRPDDNQKKDE